MFESRIKGRLQKFIPLPPPAFLGGRGSPKFTVCPEKHRNFLSWIYSIFLWIHIGWKYNISTSESNIGVKMNPPKQWKTSEKGGGVTCDVVLQWSIAVTGWPPPPSEHLYCSRDENSTQKLIFGPPFTFFGKVPKNPQMGGRGPEQIFLTPSLISH